MFRCLWQEQIVGFIKRKEGIPGNFPQMPIRVSEIPAVASPEDLLNRFDDGCAQVGNDRQNLINFCLTLGIVSKGDAKFLKMMSYYISPRFLNKLSVHITKNYLELPNVKVPLILGIHGRKGEGKSFQCELVFKRMGLGVVYMSAGELESPDAGDPARLVRLRYREAGEWSRVHGHMAVLMINDLDAGAGRVDQYTQYTVNTQLVNATLMNIADHPTNVQLPGSYEQEPTQRVPIVATGNDFSTLYAPLIRDGRMEKFYWEPDRSDRIGIVGGIFAVDGLPQTDVEALVNAFPHQAIDFFGALRSRLYDEQVFKFIQDVGIDRVSKRVVNSTDAPPEFRQPNFSLPHLLEVGDQMIQEQKRVQEMNLAEEYHKSLYFNRKLGDTAEHPPLSQFSDQLSPPYYRTYSPSSASSPNGQSQTTTSYAGQPSSTRLSPEIVKTVSQILHQGQRLGIEYVDQRRFRTNSWQCFVTLPESVAEPRAALDDVEACLNEHQDEYVRLVGIDPKTRRRLVERIIQRPNNKMITSTH
jgi:ribulose bisphosphate carboxylase small subunit